jgi:hypothetical protein
MDVCPQTLYRIVSLLGHHTGVLDVTVLATKMLNNDSVLRQVKGMASEATAEIKALQVNGAGSDDSSNLFCVDARLRVCVLVPVPVPVPTPTFQLSAAPE